MKENGSGHILNVSSYFGGEKYLAVAYPNRADYSVSKAGQRSLAEILSRHLGPEIQINAMAPGPVDGARLRGLGGTPGLFARRARLILENKRLNRVHHALLSGIESSRRRQDRGLPRSDGPKRPGWVERLGHGTRTAPAVDRPGRRRLTGRDRHALPAVPTAGRKTDEPPDHGGLAAPEKAERFLERFEPPPGGDFFYSRDVDRTAQKIEAGILDRLHLHKMPTDEQVALSTVFSLADDIISGETLHPSGGLKFDRSVTEGEMMLRPGAEDLEQLAGRHVVLLGEALRDELVAIACGLVDQQVGSLTILTETEDTADAVRAAVESNRPESSVQARAIQNAFEEGLDQVQSEQGRIDAVISTPFARLPMNPLAAEAGGPGIGYCRATISPV
jgi:malonyl-CoA reductase/3-hydroxypropionate dehydrogenase (NADP+)